MHVVVLGAGLAGLSAAWELVRAGRAVTVLERAAFVGAGARVLEREGRTLELGPRVLATDDAELRDYVRGELGVALVERAVAPALRLGRAELAPPFALRELLGALPVETALRAARDAFVERARGAFGARPELDLAAWFRHRHGRALADELLAPWAATTLGLPPAHLDARAALGAEATELFADVGALRREPRIVHVPEHGGVAAITRALHERLLAAGADVRLCAGAIGIEHRKGRARHVAWERDGVVRLLACDAVVAALPLAETALLLAPEPSTRVRAAALADEPLACVHVHVELPTERATNAAWTHVLGRGARVRRVTEPAHFAPDAAPRARTVLACELPARLGDARWTATSEALARLVEDELVQLGIDGARELRVLEWTRVRRARAVPDRGRAARLAELARTVDALANVLRADADAEFGRMEARVGRESAAAASLRVGRAAGSGAHALLTAEAPRARARRRDVVGREERA